jgi:hypothetical protein
MCGYVVVGCALVSGSRPSRLELSLDPRIGAAGRVCRDYGIMAAALG